MTRSLEKGPVCVLMGAERKASSKPVRFLLHVEPVFVCALVNKALSVQDEVFMCRLSFVRVPVFYK